jgi:hypothetical protein
MSARMTTPEIEQIMNKTTLFDTRRYSRKYKPLMFIFFTFEDKVYTLKKSVVFKVFISGSP